MFSHRALLPSLVLLFCAVCGSPDADAHASGEDYIFLSINADSITGHFEIHEKDLLEKLGIEMPVAEAPEVDAVLTKSAPRVHDYIRKHFSMAPAGGDPFTLNFGRTKVFDLEVKRFAQYYFSIPLTELPNVLEFDHRMFYEGDLLHRGLVAINYNEHTKTNYGGEFAALLFSPRKQKQRLDLTGDIEGLLRPVQFIGEGVWHIWIGIDHILFLAVLLLPAVLRREDGKWKPVASFSKAGWNVLKIVTVFTIAHSITLTLAALDLVRMPSQLVESVIAASIVLVALNNIFPKIRGGSIAVIFGFGLFHGLGFASVMGELPFRIVDIKKVILAFNAGVELGQIAIVVPIFIVLFLVRKSRFYNATILAGGSALAGAVALVWFVQRAFGIG